MEILVDGGKVDRAKVVWLSQKLLGVLGDVDTHTVNYHRKKIFDDAA